MQDRIQSAEAIKDIRRMMERSSRFISLSGLSGVSAGICALMGAWLAYPYVDGQKEMLINADAGVSQAMAGDYSIILNTWLFYIAIGTFTAAFITAFLFTFLKSKKDGTTVWSSTAKRLMISVVVPMVVGGIFLFRMAQFGSIGLIAPGCLIFYGLALINASKYTLAEIKYLGYIQLILGLINLFFIGYGLYFWAFGFGFMHIFYGLYMWNKYDRQNSIN